MCGLCGFLYKDPSRYGPVGRAMFDMLTPLDRRGTDSTGVALYGEPSPDSYVVRVRMEANGATPSRVHDALASAGTVSEEAHTGANLRARVGYDGDLGDLTDLVEQVPETEVFSIGRAMEIVKEVGDVRDVERVAPFAGTEGSHAIGHTRMATESLVDVAHSHPFWARPYATSRSSTTATSPTTTSSGASWRRRATASPPATTRRRSPSTSQTSWRPASRWRTPCGHRCTTSTARSPT